MTHEDFTSFFIIAPPTPTDNRNDESGGGPWGRWNADGSAKVSINAGDVPLTVTQISGTSWKILNATEGGGAPENYWESVQGVLVGDYVCYRTIVAAERGYVTGFDTTTVTGDTLLVTAWNTWSGEANQSLKIGGSLKALGTGASWSAFCTTSFLNADSKPPCLWIQTGNTLSDTVMFTNNGSNAVPLSISGYVTTPGDTCAGTDRPVISNTAGSGSALTLMNRQYLSFENLIVEHTGASNTDTVINMYSSSCRAMTFCGCKIISANAQTEYGVVRMRGYGTHLFVGCELQGASAGSLLFTMFYGGPVVLVNCTLVNGGLAGSNCVSLLNYGHAVFDGCLFKTVQGGVVMGLSGSTGLCVTNCVFDGLASGVTMVNAAEDVNSPIFCNCVFMPYSGTTLFPAGRAVQVDNCATYGTLGTVFGENNIELSGDPFVSRATNDYRPNLASAAGRQLFSVGYPSALPGLSLSTNYVDVGACQSRPLLTPEIIA